MDQILTFLLRHFLPVCVVHHSIEVRRAGPSNGHWLTHTHASNGHAPHLALLVHSIISSHNQTSHQTVPVLIADLLESNSSILDSGRPALLNLGKVQLVFHYVRDSLSVSSRARSAAEDAVGDWGEFVSHPVSYPSAHAGPAVRANDHASLKLNCNQGCSSGNLFTPGKPVLRNCLLAKSREVVVSE